MNLQIISATDRPNSHAIKISNYIKQLYKQQGVDAGIISLEDFPMADVIGGKYG